MVVRKGFTLIELMIVLAIVATLLSIAVPRYYSSIDRSKEAVLKENLYQMRDAIGKYHADKGKYPADLQSLVSEKYLRSIAPDPFTGSAETWQPIPSELDPGNPSAEAGIVDVKSGSAETGSDGRPYSEWE